MKDLRTAKAKAAAKRAITKLAAESRAKERRILSIIGKVWKSGAPWQPIRTCPFEALNGAGGLRGYILVTDGKEIALARVKRRFGRPMRWAEPPELAMTDGGISYVGGKLEEIKAPAWWFKWELEDVNGSMTYAGGHETGREEVPFIATKWLPLPILPPKSSA